VFPSIKPVIVEIRDAIGEVTYVQELIVSFYFNNTNEVIVPMVNATSLKLIRGEDLLLDASQSYSTFAPNSTSDLSYKWICP
jgi:hypothetical protein